MGHWALAHAELSNAPPSGLNIDRRTPKAIDVISNVKQVEAPRSRELINGHANHVGVPRIAGGLTDRLKKAVARPRLAGRRMVPASQIIPQTEAYSFVTEVAQYISLDSQPDLNTSKTVYVTTEGAPNAQASPGRPLAGAWIETASWPSATESLREDAPLEDARCISSGTDPDRSDHQHAARSHPDQPAR